jgi:hypothetical protein
VEPEVFQICRANPRSPQAAQAALEGVAGAGIDIKILAAGELLDRNVDADARAVIARIGQGGQPVRGGGIQRAEAVVRSRNQRSPSTARAKQSRARLPWGAPRRRRPASSSLAVNWAR